MQTWKDIEWKYTQLQVYSFKTLIMCLPHTEGKFFVAGLNLTEDAKYVLEHLTSSMKDMTMSNYPELLDWVKKQQCGPGKTCLNIIAADFVGLNNFIPLVIEMNQKTN